MIIGRCGCNRKFVIFKVMCRINILSVSNEINYLQMNATTPPWWLVNTGLGKGLVPSGNKPFPEPMLATDLCRHMASLGQNELTVFIMTSSNGNIFPRYWPIVRGIHRSPVSSPHKGQWRRALMLSLISTRINGWVNNGEAGDLRRLRAHYDVTVMLTRTMCDEIAKDSMTNYFVDKNY